MCATYQNATVFTYVLEEQTNEAKFGWSPFEDRFVNKSIAEKKQSWKSQWDDHMSICQEVVGLAQAVKPKFGHQKIIKAYLADCAQLNYYFITGDISQMWETKYFMITFPIVM